MKIALFGGTFDPVHSGHIRAATAAARRFRLDRILFVASGNPPHKQANELTPFAHRFAMVVLACAGEPRFVPSLLEAPKPSGTLHYSVDTLRRLRRLLGARDRLYFLVGLDAFLDVRQWKDPHRLLNLADFIVVSRPGFHIQSILEALPPRVAALARPHAHQNASTLRLRRSQLHILSGVDVPVASHEIRAALRAGRSVTGLVPPLVEEYIRKEKCYRSGRPKGLTA